MTFLRIPFLLLCLAGATAASASDAPPMGSNDGPPPAMGDGGDGHRPPHGHHRPGPPPEALAACKGLGAGAATTLKTPSGDTLKGSCQLVFVPEMKDGRDGNQPPPPPAHGGSNTGW